MFFSAFYSLEWRVHFREDLYYEDCGHICPFKLLGYANDPLPYSVHATFKVFSFIDP